MDDDCTRVPRNDLDYLSVAAECFDGVGVLFLYRVKNLGSSVHSIAQVKAMWLKH